MMPNGQKIKVEILDGVENKIDEITNNSVSEEPFPKSPTIVFDVQNVAEDHFHDKRIQQIEKEIFTKQEQVLVELPELTKYTKFAIERKFSIGISIGFLIGFLIGLAMLILPFIIYLVFILILITPAFLLILLTFMIFSKRGRNHIIKYYNGTLKKKFGENKKFLIGTLIGFLIGMGLLMLIMSVANGHLSAHDFY